MTIEESTIRYFRFSRREIADENRIEWRMVRRRHNRRYLRVASLFSLLVCTLLSFHRFFSSDSIESPRLHQGYLILFCLLGTFSFFYLLFSHVTRQRNFSRLMEVMQHVTIIGFLFLFGVLSFLDLQVAPEYSAAIGFIFFLSVTMWISTLSFAAYLVLFNGLVLAGYLIGVHPSVAGSELLVEMVLFSVMGGALFYAISGVRTQNFVTQKRLAASMEELREMSLLDPLTRLFNRRMMNDELDKETALSRRSGLPVTVLLLDLDHFKKINDRLGHAVGDEVLKECGARLTAVVRESDRVYRFGGEEFLIMLPNSSLPSSRALAKRLQERFADEQFESVPWPVTFSMGIADTNEESTPAGLIKLADCRLYAAKEAGRDRFVYEGCRSSDSPPESAAP